MKALPAVAKRNVFLRSLLVQGSWNYETLIGTGFAFTLLPALRAIHGDDPAKLREMLARHAEVFNSHPYLANVAIGAVARLEADNVDPRVVVRFKSALRGSLGSIGDQLVWGAWRPASALLGLVLFLGGAPWWLAVIAFLVVYNSINLGLRIWGWQIGTTAGLEVGRAIRDAPLQALALRATEVGSLLAGVAVVVGSSAARENLGLGILNGLAIGVGIWLGLRARTALTIALAVLVVIGIVSGLAK